MRPAVASTLTLAVLGPAFTACGLLGDGGHLDDALDLVPVEATDVEFVDRSALAERLDVEDADADQYLEAVAEDAVSGTRLVRYLAVMGEAAFDERDVEWAVTGNLDDGLFSVYKVDDDVDLDSMADDLAELGFAEDDVLGRRHLVGDLQLVDDLGRYGEAYPIDFREVVVDPDEHLVVLGDGAEAVLATLDDDEDSMTDADTFDDVLDDTEDVEYAWLDRDPACGGAAGSRATPEQLAAVADQLGDLGTPEVTAFLVSGGDADQSARLQFADDDAAETDLEARRTYLEDGSLLATRQPFSDVGSAELERDGAVVRVELDLESPQVGRRMAQESDGFLVCPP